MINGALLRRTWRAQRLRMILVAAALAAWGFLMPVIYATFGSELRQFVESNPLFERFSQFGDADLFSLPGSIALGFVHPIAVALLAVFAVGFAAAAVAGERQRGTLEVLLARPVARHALYATLLTAALAFLGIAILALIAGAVAGAAAFGVSDELRAGNLPALWLNGWLLFAAFAGIGLAASVSFDRLAPAVGVTLAIVLISYFLDILGSLWPDARPLQPFSLFHYLRPRTVLEGGLQVSDAGVLAVVLGLAIAYALAVFPRRDLAAPS